MQPASPADLNSAATQPTGTQTGTGEKAKAGAPTAYGTARQWKATGGAVDVQFMKEDRLGADYWRFSKNNPALWHAYNRLSHAASFIDYLIERIYSRRGVVIIPEHRIRAIEYAEKFYFPDPMTTAERIETIYKPCITLEDYANRVNGLKWCIDAANRYAAKNNGFFVLPLMWIDVENKNGLTKMHDWYRNSKKNEKDRAIHVKNIKDIRRLQEQIRIVTETPTNEVYERAKAHIERHIPKYIYVFERNVATILKRYENDNNV